MSLLTHALRTLSVQRCARPIVSIPKRTNPVFEAATHMYIPRPASTAGASVPACTSDSIHAPEDVAEDKKDFIVKNAAFFRS
jgi:hypothetical protein